MTKAPATIMYVGIVFRETVRIALMIPCLNYLDVKSGNILKDYMQAPVTVKAWITFSPAFSVNARKTAVIVRALYGLKVSRSSF